MPKCLILFWLSFAAVVLQPASAQLTASIKTIDLGNVASDQLQSVSIANNTNTKLRCFPIEQSRDFHVGLSLEMERNEMGSMDFRFKNQGERRIREKILIYTDFQKAPIEIRIKANLNKYREWKCPEFSKGKVRMKRKFHTAKRQRDDRLPVLSLFDAGERTYPFTTNPAIPNCHIIILLDASASMISNGKLDEIKEVIKRLVRSLRPDDELSILKYNDRQEVVVVKMAVKHLSELIAAIDGIEPWGYTNGYEGVESAVKLCEQYFNAKVSNHILLCSDGAFNTGADTPEIKKLLISRQRQFSFHFSVLSVGSNIQHGNKLKQLANSGKGYYFTLDPAHLKPKKIQRMLLQQLI